MPWTLSAFADEAGDSTQQQIDALHRAGLKYVDLRGIEGFNITALPVEKAKEIRAAFDRAGVKVAMFGSPIGKIDIAEDLQIDLDKVAHLGKLAPILGCNAVRIFSYYNKQNQPMAAWQAESIRRLKELRSLAEKVGLVLYHENERHIFGDQLAQVQVIAREVRNHSANKPGSFRMIFDFDNFNQAGEDVWAAWQALRDVTDAFHLKESKRGADGVCQHCLVGSGDGQVKRILGDALGRKWQGQLTLEPHLKHSKAVMATGPSGQANQAFVDMSAPDCFHAAAMAAKGLLTEIKAPMA